jgi:hypothetical protein
MRRTAYLLAAVTLAATACSSGGGDLRLGVGSSRKCSDVFAAGSKVTDDFLEQTCKENGKQMIFAFAITSCSDGRQLVQGDPGWGFKGETWHTGDIPGDNMDGPPALLTACRGDYDLVDPDEAQAVCELAYDNGFGNANSSERRVWINDCVNEAGKTTGPDTQEPTTTIEPEQGSTKQDPLATGDAGSVGDYVVRVTTVNLDADAVVAKKRHGAEPSNGRWVVVTYDATYAGPDEGTPGIDLSFKLSGGDARQYSSQFCSELGGDSFDITLEPGGTATEALCFDVPPEAVGGAAIFAKGTFDVGSEDQRIYWSTT